MRASIFAALGLAVAAIVLHAAPVKAQSTSYAWCLEGGGGRSCTFNTRDQCLASKGSGAGNCLRNPAFSPKAYVPRARPRQDSSK